MNSLAIIVAAVAGLAGTVLGGFLAETRKLVTGAPAAYASVVADLREEVRRLHVDNAELREQIEALRGYVDELRDVIRRVGVTPPPVPEEWLT